MDARCRFRNKPVVSCNKIPISEFYIDMFQGIVYNDNERRCYNGTT